MQQQRFQINANKIRFSSVIFCQTWASGGNRSMLHDKSDPHQNKCISVDVAVECKNEYHCWHWYRWSIKSTTNCRWTGLTFQTSFSVCTAAGVRTQSSAFSAGWRRCNPRRQRYCRRRLSDTDGICSAQYDNDSKTRFLWNPHNVKHTHTHTVNRLNHV